MGCPRNDRICEVDVMAEGISRESARVKHGPSDLELGLEQTNKKLRKTIKELRKRTGSEDYLIEQLRRNMIKIGALPQIQPVSMVEIDPEARELVPILVIADPHMEEVVDARETNGMAEWNFPRFLSSMWVMLEKAIAYARELRASNIITDIHVFMLGDMVTGEIHTDVYHTNAFYLPDALTYGPFYWGQFFRELSAHFRRVIITCVPGNHGRLDIKPTSKRTVGRNWDTCMYQNTAVQTRNIENIIWNIPRSPKTTVEVNGWSFLLQHGDRVPQHGGTVPYYGMLRQRSAEIAKRIGFRVKDIPAQIAKGLLFDYDMRGHHHTNGSIEERVLLCPSMMGNNEFGLDNTFGHKIPGSRLLVISEEDGIYADHRINLLDLPPDHGFEVLDAWYA
jgi:hypothetical protein